MNNLSQEKSPYLKQHQNNPVNWFAWSEEAFEKSRIENKPILLSIGYSTCYWCHVMEKESFENPDVALVLNREFVCIKLDREERPDVDGIYMDVLMRLTGQGGWPLNVFLTPELKAFFGGTYFKKEQFIDIASQIAQAWKQHRASVEQTANELFLELKQTQNFSGGEKISPEIFFTATDNFKKSYDHEDGGFGIAPKFPASFSLMYLLRYYQHSKDQQVLEIINNTLEKMARGGIFDHLGGGFHRYSTDKHWLAPHFEKMLYDNALLSFTYLEAFQVTKNEMFAAVARETLNYVLRDLADSQGGIYSAEDAGDPGKEGEFYVWKQQEVVSCLTEEELVEIKKVYGVTTLGNFHNKENILNLQESYDWSIKKSKLLESAQQKLLEYRNKRKRPHLDNKVLTSWNGLIIASLAKGYQVLGESVYLEAAIKCADFIKNNLYKKNVLYHRYCEGDIKQEGLLDDYAFLIYGLLNLTEVSFDYSWLDWAIELQEQQDNLFWDEKDAGYFESLASDKNLILRKKQYHDGAEPSGNGVSALNLIKLRDFTLESKYEENFLKLLSSFAAAFNQYPNAFAFALMANDYYLKKSNQLVVVEAENDSELVQNLKELSKEFRPYQILLRSAKGKDNKNLQKHFAEKKLLNNKTTFYSCQYGSCQSPTNTLVS